MPLGPTKRAKQVVNGVVNGVGGSYLQYHISRRQSVTVACHREPSNRSFGLNGLT